MSLFAELKRRNVVRVGIAYAIVGWVLAQIAEFAFENFGAPDWVLKTFVVLLILGLPLALLFAWAFEITPEGIKREKNVDREKSIVSQTGRKLDFIIIAALMIVLTVVIWDSYLPSIDEEPEPQQTTKLESSIAVLPFLNMSSDPDQEYFADGMTEEILNTLAAIKDLRVVGRTSSFIFKERTDVDFQTIGEMLNVAYVLEGSVRKSGNKLRITAQLIAAETGYHLWSKTYDRNLADIFEIQEELATAIGEEMQLTLGVDVAQSIDGRKLGVQAMELWLQGVSASHAGELVSSSILFDQLIEMEPRHLPAYVQRAYAASYLLEVGISDEDTFYEDVQEILRLVTDMGPDSKERYEITALLLTVQGDWQGVADTLRKYSEIDSSPDQLLALSDAEWLLGNGQVSQDLVRQYLTFEPLDYLSRANYAMKLMLAGQRAEAETELARLTQMAPESLETALVLKDFQSYMNNRLAEGLKWTIISRELSDYPGDVSNFIVRLLLDLGDETAAANWLALDPGIDHHTVFRPPIEYFMARFSDDSEDQLLALARQMGDIYSAGGHVFGYLADFDWLRLLQRHDPDLALGIYRKRVPNLTTDSPDVFTPDFSLAVSLADLYLRTGKTELANNLLDQCLAQQVSSPDHYMRPSTTMIYALKGDVPSALRELRASIDANWRWEWWLLEKDRAYEVLWDEPEFKSMMDELRADMARQRAELHEMVEAGEIDLTPSLEPK